LEPANQIDQAERRFVMKRRTDMRQLTTLGVVCLAAISLAPAARADDHKCQDVNVHVVYTSIPAPNDPLGRSSGPITGDVQGAASSLITSVTPGPDGSAKATSLEVWVLGPQDILIFTCAATATPIPGAPVGTFSVSATFTATGGTGQFVGASGALNETGTIFNLTGPKAGPGSTYSDVNLKGNICRGN
jgi:hypothetical protein